MSCSWINLRKLFSFLHFPKNWSVERWQTKHFMKKMSLENHIGEIYNTWLLKVDGHHLKSGIPHDLRVIVWGIDSWSFGVCSHNVLISQRQNIYREKGKPSVVHPLSSSSSTVFLVECRFLRRGQNRSTGKKSSRSKGENQQRTQQCSPTKKA